MLRYVFPIVRVTSYQGVSKAIKKEKRGNPPRLVWQSPKFWQIILIVTVCEVDRCINR